MAPGSNSYSSIQHGGLNSSLSSQSFISFKNWQCPFHFESKKSSTNIKSKTVLATGMCSETICSSLCLDYNLLCEAQVTSEKAVSWIVYAFYIQFLFSICDVLDAVVIKRRAKVLLFSSTCWLQMIRVITEEPRKEQQQCPCSASCSFNLLMQWDSHKRKKILLYEIWKSLDAISQIAYIMLLRVGESRARGEAQWLRI